MQSEKQDLSEIEKIWGKIPKILVGAPHHARKDYTLERFAKRAKELDYPNYDILIADNSKDPDHVKVVESYGLAAIWSGHQPTAREKVREARNAIRNHALENGYDFVFFYDSDIIAPKIIIKELLKWGKKVVGGWYYIGVPSFARPVVTRTWTTVGEGQSVDRMALYKEMAKQRLMRNYIGGMGVQLIHRDILQRFRFVTHEDMGWFADSWFFYALERAGIDAFTDTEMLCPHFSDDWGEVKNK